MASPGLSIGGDKSKSKASTNQSFNQTSNSALSDRAYGLLTGRLGELGQRQYQALDPNAYRDYMNPYQEDVIAATTADINANRDMAANQQRSDLAASKAFGDDRRGIMEAALQGDYDRTLATTLAGLRSRGFSEAQGVAAGENQNRNTFDQNTQALLNQLYALLGNETTTRTTGTSQGVSKGKTTGLNFGFTYGGG